jgi:hypothetical protein
MHLVGVIYLNDVSFFVLRLERCPLYQLLIIYQYRPAMKCKLAGETGSVRR